MNPLMAVRQYVRKLAIAIVNITRKTSDHVSRSKLKAPSLQRIRPVKITQNLPTNIRLASQCGRVGYPRC